MSDNGQDGIAILPPEEEQLNPANPNHLVEHLSNGYEYTMGMQVYPNDFSFADYLAELGLPALIQYFFVFSNCQCCDRHQQRRPDVLGPLPDYPLLHGEDHQVGQCQCQCRHLARWFCRALPMVPAEQAGQPEQAGEEDTHPA